MSYYKGPEDLAEHAPWTWRVERVSVGSRAKWALYIDDGDTPLHMFDTRRAATDERDNPESYTRRAVEKERLWYEGVTPDGWKSYDECMAERRPA